MSHKKAQLARSSIKKDIKILKVKLGYPLEVITHETGKAMGLHLTGMFKPCEDCAFEKSKKGSKSKMAVENSKIMGERLLFNTSKPLTPTLGDKKHWL